MTVGITHELSNFSPNNLDELLYPTTHEGWIERYEWLMRRIIQMPYSVNDLKRFRMFRALDSSGNELDVTRPVLGAVGFVARQGARACGGAQQVLSPSEKVTGSREQWNDLGDSIWRRSRWKRQKDIAARSYAGLGDVFIEAVRLDAKPPYRPVIAFRDPRCVQVEYDTDTYQLKKAIIKIKTFEGIEVDAITGLSTRKQALQTYVRVLTPESITVYRNGELSASESGPHGLGVVPLVHVPFETWGDYLYHGLPCYHGLTWAAVVADSGWSQAKAIATRYANPKWFGAGIDLSNAQDLDKFGRILSTASPDATLNLLEASLSQIGPVLDLIEKVTTAKSHQYPEFLFAEAGANASGEALKMLGTAYEAKYKPARAAFFDAIAEVTEMAAMLSLLRPFEDLGLYTVSAEPLLPVDVEREIRILTSIAPNLKRVDVTRRLQELNVGIPADADPEVYAVEVEAERVGSDVGIPPVGEE
jgi:hypothetical protein